MDSEPPGIGSVLDSGIYNLMPTFPAVWKILDLPSSLIVLIVYGQSDLKSTKISSFFNLFFGKIMVDIWFE